MAPKKQTKRSREKYPALKPQLNLRSRYELIDYDYIDQLSEEEKDWLNRFTEEYVNANFKHKGNKISRKKEHRKDSYDRNNARNRCILTQAKAQGKSVDFYTLENKAISGENDIIEKIDESMSDDFESGKKNTKNSNNK